MDDSLNAQASNELGGPRPQLAHATKRALRWNAVLSLALLLGITVMGNMLAAQRLRVRTDFSEDGLNSISGATRSILSRIDDRVTIRLFATEDVEDGQLALRTARIRSQLSEILGLRPEVFELQSLDPTRSSEAQRNAIDVGFRPARGQASAMEGGGSGDPVWLSLEMTYRSRTERIPTPRPFEFETQFASALHSLLADRRPGIGWIGANIDPPPPTPGQVRSPQQALVENADPTYTYLRTSLERRAKFEVLVGLETGRAVPDDIDVTFVMHPGRLPERTVYALDRFVQRGGRLIICVDDPSYNALLGQARAPQPQALKTSPFGRLLRGWGIGVLTERHLWDGKWKSVRNAVVGIREGSAQVVQLNSPMIITVPDEGLSDAVSPTRGVERVQFSWAHPVVPEVIQKLPPGVEREDLVWTSTDARLDDVAIQLSSDPKDLRNRMTYLRQKPGMKHVIAAAFSGLFPSPWDTEAPPPILGPDGQPSSARESATPAAATKTPSQVVIFGDADWLRDPWSPEQRPLVGFGGIGGLVLAENLVDWLTLDEELIGLRSRAPKPRPLRDFLTEEMKSAGVFERDPYETESERLERDQASDRARQIARGKQWITMLVPAGGALLVLALFGVLWNLLQRPRRSAADVSLGGASDE